MREIDLSTMADKDQLQLNEFEANTFIHVRHQAVPWPDAWNRIMQFSIYQKGPDVSQVGNTWFENLDEMNALRAFTPQDINSLGGKDVFLPSMWPEHASKKTISIPWIIDTRFIYFRRDMLAKAGVNEATAFTSPQALLETLCRLRDSGVSQYPFAMANSGLIVHNLASWLWANGGEFRSSDGRKILMLEPEARQGIIDYFRLHEFLSRDSYIQDTAVAEQKFFRGEVPVLYSGQWTLSYFAMKHPSIAQEVHENLGQAVPPGGVPYLGGSHLVIWRYSIHDSEAMELMRHLTSPEVLTQMAVSTHGFPARRDVLSMPFFSENPLFNVVVECAMKGRVMQSLYRWTAVEVRINDFCTKMWADLLANPELNIGEEVDSRLTILSNRLEKTVLSSW